MELRIDVDSEVNIYADELFTEETENEEPKQGRRGKTEVQVMH